MKTLFISPIGQIRNLYPITFAFVKALEAKGLKVGYVKPISHSKKDIDILYQHVFGKTAPASMKMNNVEKSILTDHYDTILEKSIELVMQAHENNDVVIIEGVELNARNPFTEKLNLDLAATFQSGLIFAGNSGRNTLCEIGEYLDFYIKRFDVFDNELVGFVANRMADKILSVEEAACQVVTEKKIPCLGLIGENESLSNLDEIVAFIAENLKIDSLVDDIKNYVEKPITTPAFFKYQLIDRARKANKRIVLPEGDEPRTLKAAVICHDRQIANCVLLGERAEIEAVAAREGIQLPEGIEIIEPASIADQYIDKMVELRAHKGLTPEKAKEQIQDRVVLGTMMLAVDDVDGLVSGAVHTTADTIRPAFQFLGTEKGSKIVSSIFFMLMPEGAHVYGDCAVNPNPTPEQLAGIAVQSANSAKAFGIDPRVAMISYSTGTSGAGPAVDAVKEATEIAKTLDSSLLIDGPIQFDAAYVPSVGKQKLPNSPVAGQATVFIFPDLNTGNTTYKAVQRSANLISIGPVLQGLAKPVNDLSRGALVEDIVYTIAITAVQAAQQK
ncbi:phosphate acetyltransferase [Wohlfahrtiimonas larvae]|uniref:Phosphate acetyltransferase n=1 Tax=Wohlfahrtiimonas larvae TaxID=1157986 RepID=A0ABP9MPS6_9GAMM|nr:phosphate acetyltransferase [Wohlfahrtiimonas larvae]